MVLIAIFFTMKFELANGTRKSVFSYFTYNYPYFYDNHYIDLENKLPWFLCILGFLNAEERMPFGRPGRIPPPAPQNAVSPITAVAAPPLSRGD